MSHVGLGGSLFGRICDLQQTRRVVDAALECGINFVDTAEAYPGSEELLGSALLGRRQQVVLASKFGHPQDYPSGGAAARETVRGSIEGTLRRLQTDYVDIYMLHFPEPSSPIEATLAALEELVGEGKVRWLGVSNFAAWELVEAQLTAKFRGLVPLLCAENRYSLFDREIEHDVLPVCRRYELTLIPYSPLASGLLSGQYARDMPPAKTSRLAGRWSRLTDADFEKLDRLTAFAAARGISLLELAIGWLAAQPAVGPVITGATKPEQIRANAAAGEWCPSEADLAALRALD